MKIIILFALVGVSLCGSKLQRTEFHKPYCTVPATNKHAKEEDCLIKALKSTPEFLDSVGTYMCLHKSSTQEERKELFMDGYVKGIRTLNCTGCSLDKFIGTDKTLEELLAKLGDSAAAVLDLGVTLKETLKIDGFTMELLCTVTGDLLKSTCMKNLAAKSLPKLVEQLEGAFCKQKRGRVDAGLVINMLIETGCMADDALRTGDTVEGLVQKLIQTLGEQNVQNLAQSVLDTLKELPVVKEVIALVCPLLDITKGGLGSLGGLGGLASLGGLGALGLK